MDYREKVNRAFADARGDKICMGFQEFMDVQVPEPQDGDMWGNWTFQKRDLTLQYRNAEDYAYEVDLEQIDTTLALVIWMKDLSHKVFMSPEDVGNLFIAVQDLINPWWMPETNVTKLIRQKYGTPAKSHK